MPRRAKPETIARRLPGEGWIKEIAPGRWRAAVRLPQPDGSVKRVWLRGTDRDALLARMRERQVDAARGVVEITNRTKLSDYLDEWLADLGTSVRETTRRSYTYQAKHLKAQIGGHELGSLRPEHVQRMVTRLSKDRSPQQAAACLTLLRHALGRAVKWRVLQSNPAELVDPPRVTPKPTKPLAPADLLTLLRYAEEHADRQTALWFVLATCGLRLGEALGLEWDDLDLDAATLTVRRQCVHINGAFDFPAPKSAKGLRTVPLTARTVAVLHQHRERQRVELLKTGLRYDRDLVFLTLRGLPYRQQVVTYDWQRLCKAAGVPVVRIHDLRHGYSTVHVRSGTDARELQQFMGHSNISLTLGLYTHVGEDANARAKARLDAFFGPPVAPAIATDAAEAQNEA